MIDLNQLARPLRHIDVYSGCEYSGRLLHEHGSFNFSYASANARAASLTMQPANSLSYNASQLFNIFEIIVRPAIVMEQFADVISDRLNQKVICSDFPELRNSIRSSLTRSAATNNVFLKTDVKRPKKRKTDSLL